MKTKTFNTFAKIAKKINGSISQSISEIAISKTKRSEDIISHNLVRDLIKVPGAISVEMSNDEPINGSDLIVAVRNLERTPHKTFYLHLQAKNAKLPRETTKKKEQKKLNSTIAVDLGYKGSKTGIQKILKMFSTLSLNSTQRSSLNHLKQSLDDNTYNQLKTQFHYCKLIENTLPLYFVYCFWKKHPHKVTKDVMGLFAFSETLYHRPSIHLKSIPLKKIKNFLHSLNGHTLQDTILNNYGYIGERSFENFFEKLTKLRTQSFQKLHYYLIEDRRRLPPIFQARANLSPRSKEKDQNKVDRAQAAHSLQSFINKINAQRNLTKEFAGDLAPLPFAIEDNDKRIEQFKGMGLRVCILNFGIPSKLDKNRETI
ncbi:hypothetical protein [Bdellovibrio sp. HCB-162]|uniref:hypothetical protein n=1 Tax=Bdellovibrio sp. HCB-162 TaxID=3394234 RepID=UPI0039BD1FE3